MFANNKFSGFVYTQLILAIGLISVALFLFSSSLSSMIFSSKSIDERTNIASTMTLVSENAKDYIRKKLLEGVLTAFPVDISEPNKPLNGGLLPKSIAFSKLDPWGTRIGVCSYFLGSDAFPAAFSASHDGVVRGNEDSTGNSVLFAIVLAGKNKSFETECSQVIGSEVRPLKAGDDIVWMFSVNQIKIAMSSPSSDVQSFVQGFVNGFDDLASLDPVAGDAYLVLDQETLYWYNGTSWNAVKAGSIADSYSGSDVFDLSGSTVSLTRPDMVNCNTDIPVKMFSHSETDSFGLFGLTSYKSMNIYGSNASLGIIALNRLRHQETAPCGDNLLVFQGNTASGPTSGLRHKSALNTPSTPTTSNFKNHSFETTGTLCNSGCPVNLIVSNKNTRRDGHFYMGAGKATANSSFQLQMNNAGVVIPAGNYTLKFDYSPTAGGDAATNRVRVAITQPGAAIGQIEVEESGLDLPPGRTRWKTYSFSFNLAAKSDTRVVITGLGTVDNYYGLIDNLRLHSSSNLIENEGLLPNDFSFNDEGIMLSNDGTVQPNGQTYENRFFIKGDSVEMKVYGTNTLYSVLYFQNRNLPASDFIRPGLYSIDATTAMATADPIRTLSLTDTSDPVTDDLCVEGSHYFNAGAVIADHYGNIYVCQ